MDTESDTQVPSTGDGDGDGDVLGPVPEARAQEDGQRIVNLYRTTDDGLKTHEGYFDTVLGLQCAFRTVGTDDERCVPLLSAFVGGYFSDDSCADPLVAIPCGSEPPKVVGVVVESSLDCVPSYVRPHHRAGHWASTVFHKQDDDCVVVEGAQDTQSFYRVGEAITDLATGTLAPQ